MASSFSTPSSPRIIRGTTFVFLALDIAFSVDLDAAERLLTGASTERATIKHSRKAPPYFEYRPAPLRVTLDAETLDLGDGFAITPTVELLVFDFGAVSVCYRVPLSGHLDALVDLAESVYDNKRIFADACKRLEHLTTIIGPALARPRFDDAVEDYIIHQIEELEGHAEPADAVEQHARLFARILRSERGELSTQETSDALSATASYRPGDAAIIDWNAALLLDREADDSRAVLEFANVEALEMRVLDDRLDQVLDDAYRAFAQGSSSRLGGLIPVPRSRTLHRIARLQLDSAILYEGVNNAIKLVGDQYLARLYRLAAARFHLPERDLSIERKLSTLESIYAKFEDAQSALRMELLEWIIIILIAVSIVLPFFIAGAK